MANYLTTDTDLTAVANAIRTKGGTTASLSFPNGYVQAINDISTGGITPTGTISITSNGTHDVTNYASANVNVSSGGGSSKRKQITFIDYDGTVIDSYTATEWASVTALPTNPSHTGLVAQGWNWTKAQIDAQLTELPDGDITVGQMYITESGDTEIEVSMTEAKLSPIMTICVNGTVTIDWGDNTAPDTVTGTSLTNQLAVPHTYASANNYVIVIHVTSGAFQFVGSSSITLLRKNTTQSQNIAYANCIKSVKLGNGTTSIGTYAFYSCYSLVNITIPSGVTNIGDYAFSNCFSLVSATIPSGATTLGGTFNLCRSLASVALSGGTTRMGANLFTDCFSLTSVTIPYGVTYIGQAAFSGCYTLTSAIFSNGVTSVNGSSLFYSCTALKRVRVPSGLTIIANSMFRECRSLTNITIPSGVTNLDNYAFYNCYSLTSVTVPSGVTRIGTYVFYNCSGMSEYHLLPSTPPTLESTNAFHNRPSDCMLYVPSASLSAYQSATNWSTYASYMVGE